MIQVTIVIEDLVDRTAMEYMIAEIGPTTAYEYIVATVVKDCIIKVHKYTQEERSDDQSTGSAE